MIDFVKILYQDKRELENHVRTPEKYNEVYINTEITTDTAVYPLKTSFEGMDIIIRKDTAEVRNSLHQLYNYVHSGERHNYNDFTYSHLMEMIDLLAEKIPEATTKSISKLEFGINIPTDRPAKEIVRQAIMHKESFCSEYNKFKGKGEYKRFTRSQFDVKIYDKQLQYQTDNPTLRFEIVFKGGAALRKEGVWNLKSLRSKRILRQLFIYLLKRFDEMVIIDDFHSLTDSEDKCLLYKYSNTIFWHNQIQRSSSQNKRQHRIKFKNIIQKHGLNTLQLSIRNSLVSKFDFLINN